MEQVQGWSEAGGTSVVVPGTQGSGSQRFQQSFRGCTVTVRDSSNNLATIYSDDLASPTAKANPFTSSSTTGLWSFYTTTGSYSITFSGGAITAPFSITVNVGLGNAGGVPSYAYASLPTSKSQNAGDIARVTDNIRGLWMDNGTQWVSISGGANIQDFGAIPDSAGTNNATAILAAISAAIDSGFGRKVIFPEGNYYVATEMAMPGLVSYQTWQMDGFVRITWNGATDATKSIFRTTISSTVAFNSNTVGKLNLNGDQKCGFCFVIEGGAGTGTLGPGGGQNRFSQGVWEGATVANLLIGDNDEPYADDVNASKNVFEQMSFYNALYNVKINALNAQENTFPNCIFGSNISGVVKQHARIIWGLRTTFDNPEFGTMERYADGDCTSIYAETPVTVRNVYMEESRLFKVADGGHYVDNTYLFQDISVVDSRSDASLNKTYFGYGNGSITLKRAKLDVTGVLSPIRLLYLYGNRFLEDVDLDDGYLLNEAISADTQPPPLTIIDGYRAGGFTSLTRNWDFEKWLASVAAPTGDTPAVWSQFDGTGGDGIIEVVTTNARYGLFTARETVTVAPSDGLSGLVTTVDKQGYLTVIMSGKVDALTTLPAIIINDVEVTTYYQFGEAGDLSGLRFVAWAEDDLRGAFAANVTIKAGIKKNLTGVMWIDTIVTLGGKISKGLHPGLIYAAPEQRLPAVYPGIAAPTVKNWNQGDFIQNMTPAGATPVIGWICTVTGSPGTWVALTAN